MDLWLAVALALVAAGEAAALVVLLTRHRRLQRAHTELVRRYRARAQERSVLGGAQKAVQIAAKTADRLRRGGLGGVLAGSVDDLARWAREDRSEIRRVATPEGVVTFMFTDIEDSTAVNVRVGDRAWLRVLQAQESVVRVAVGRRGGHVIKSLGDGFMVVFGAPDAALAAAVDIQRAVSRRARGALRRHPIRLRIGLHVGSALARDGDYFGRDVAMAARVAGEADGGEILLSEETFAALPEHAEPTILDQREVQLRGFDEPQLVRSVDWE